MNVSIASGYPRARRTGPAAIEVTFIAGIISTSGDGLQLVQRQFSNRLDKLYLIEIRHFNLPLVASTDYRFSSWPDSFRPSTSLF
jgi:hypothetical protein